MSTQNVLQLLTETWRYLSGSPLSHTAQREALLQLDDHELADIGLTRDDAQRGRRAA